MALHCNAISHWLGTYTEWSLSMRPSMNKISVKFSLCWEHKIMTETEVQISEYMLDLQNWNLYAVLDFDIYLRYHQHCNDCQKHNGFSNFPKLEVLRQYFPCSQNQYKWAVPPASSFPLLMSAVTPPASQFLTYADTKPMLTWRSIQNGKEMQTAQSKESVGKKFMYDSKTVKSTGSKSHTWLHKRQDAEQMWWWYDNIDGLVQYCSISSALAMLSHKWCLLYETH